MKAILLNLINLFPGDSLLYWLWGLSIFMVFGIVGAVVVKYSEGGENKLWAKRLRLVGIIAVTLFTSWMALLQLGGALYSKEDYLNGKLVPTVEENQIQSDITKEEAVSQGIKDWCQINGFVSLCEIKDMQFDDTNSNEQYVNVDIHASQSPSDKTGYLLRLSDTYGEWLVSSIRVYPIERYEPVLLEGIR
ncbi:MAG: hypothetical protein COT89_00065 [Candidatus Colwellbacteria bacterium CG10_big_fil_rev_8_21_14_0_10_42_22]|uniref:Uncharacterized protein n=1 Tax=Candidatus Colwellbacteria bacterium CG10_big_fil_rev_8_21_14_0_10_42_22 TaxID=1974540 RepID=A0A2H0VGN5_9BACT|nr:MAG: hypothetical protein COT89_00065 [Candidatus Colwellbacteria bacterium CG10_big_fil_rev_8_21_14_0_10_42_22]